MTTKLRAGFAQLGLKSQKQEEFHDTQLKYKNCMINSDQYVIYWGTLQLK